MTLNSRRGSFIVSSLYLTDSSLSFNRNTYFFLQSVDSRLQRDGGWYSRFHLGPFVSGSRLQIGTRLRRSLLNDLAQVSIIAVKMEGLIHEFSRLPGIYNHILDILFQFRKISLYSSCLTLGETIIIPFIFFGPGIFYAKDIFLPVRIQCRNPRIALTTISLGKRIRGHIFIQKNFVPTFTCTNGKSICITEFWRIKNPFYKSKKSITYPWLSIGFPKTLVNRVGFRIEPMGSMRESKERLVLEVLTNGSVSPR